MYSWYRSQYAGLIDDDPVKLELAVAGVTEAYLENVFPDMNIGYCTYENRLGHRGDNGCFRCHNESLASSDGRVIEQSCDMCHVILAEDEPVGTITGTIEQSTKQILSE